MGIIGPMNLEIRGNFVENYVFTIAYSKLYEVTSSAEPSNAELKLVGKQVNYKLLVCLLSVTFLIIFHKN